MLFPSSFLFFFMLIIKKKWFTHQNNTFVIKGKEIGGGGLLWTTKLCRPILIIFIFEVFLKTSIYRQKTCIIIQTPTNIRKYSGLINSVHSSFYDSPNSTENRLNDEFQGQKVKWGCGKPFWMFLVKEMHMKKINRCSLGCSPPQHTQNYLCISKCLTCCQSEWEARCRNRVSRSKNQ